MTNELLTITNTSVPAFLQADMAKELQENKSAISGIKGSDFLPSLSIKGKCFSVRSNGQTQPLNTNELDVVIVAARPTLSKIYYESGYNPKEVSAPKCASLDSETADFATDLIDPMTNKCCHNCANCYFNQFGSSTQGKGKACKDYKRLVVMPASRDGKTFPQNAPAFILDVPATSLKAPKGTNAIMLREYIDILTRGKIPMSAYVVTLRFVMNSEFPQLTFEPKRWVIQEELARVKELREMDTVKDALTLRHELAEDDDKMSPTATQPASPVETPAPQAAGVGGPTLDKPKEEITEASVTMKDEDVMANAEALLSAFRVG